MQQAKSNDPAIYAVGNDDAIIEQALAILMRRARSVGNLFDSPKAVQDYLRLHLGTKPHEVFGVIYLDSQHRLLAMEDLFRGTLTQTSVYPREVVIQALHHQAASVILYHNHPSGEATPSRADEHLTQTLKSALALVDVRVLDHFIVTANACRSMAELGLV
jgi:DNA repair protein RadC